MKAQKPISPRTSPRLRRGSRAALALLIIGGGGGILIGTLLHPGTSATNPALAGAVKTPRETLPQDPLTREPERLARLGAKAIPTRGGGEHGVPVPAHVPERELIGSGWDRDPDPAAANFARWTQAYLVADGAVRGSLEAEGLSLASARRAFLREQIPADPRRALADALPLAVREQLPAAMQPLLERRVSGFGDLFTLNTLAAIDDSPVPNRDYAMIGGESYTAHRYGSRTSTPYVQGASLHGIALDGEFAVLDSPVRTLESGERMSGATLNQYCPVSEETVASPAAGVIAAENKTVFQIGTDLYGTCEPAHVTGIETALVAGEKAADNTQARLTHHDLQNLYKKSFSAAGAPAALGDSAVSGSAGYIGKPPAALTLGGKNILIMRVQPTDKPFPASWATDSYFSDVVWRSDGWNVRTQRISYNKTWINRADITPVMNLPQASAYYTGNGYEWGRWIDDSKAAAAALGYNLADYSCFVVAHEGYSQFGAAGWGGGGNIWCNGNFDVRLFVHEYGHVFWLPHANSWYTTDGNPISPGRQHREYGDANDPMGNAWGANAFNSYNAYFKNFCGWLPDAAVQNVTRSGTYRIYQDDGGTALNRTLALKVGRDYEFNYWISIRGDAIAQANFNNGVAVMAVSSWRASDSKLLDMNNPGDDNRDNAPLAVNQSWYDSAADLTIRTVAVGGANPNRYADVQITVGPRNTGGYRPLVSGGVYRLKNRQNSKYLEVPGDSASDLVSVQVATASGTTSQNWVAWRNGDGTYSFNHQGTNKYLDVYNNGTGDGADLIQYTGNSSDAQKWQVAQNPDGYLFLTHKGTDSKVVDMDPGGVNDVHQWGHNDGAWQQWYPELMAIVPGTYRVLPRHAQAETLDIVGVSTADGAATNLWEYVGGANQKWEVSNPAGSWLRLTPTHAVAKALDVNAAGSANGTRLQQWAWYNNSAQHWAISRTDGNWLRFTPECASGSCMEVSGDDNQYGNGSTVQLWQFTGALDQQWRFADPD